MSWVKQLPLLVLKLWPCVGHLYAESMCFNGRAEVSTGQGFCGRHQVLPSWWEDWSWILLWVGDFLGWDRGCWLCGFVGARTRCGPGGCWYSLDRITIVPGAIQSAASVLEPGGNEFVFKPLKSKILVSYSSYGLKSCSFSASYGSSPSWCRTLGMRCPLWGKPLRFREDLWVCDIPSFLWVPVLGV